MIFPNGSSEAAMCLKGSWFPKHLPICIKPGCPSLGDLKNGYSSILYRGAMTWFHCDPGINKRTQHTRERGEPRINFRSLKRSEMHFSSLFAFLRLR